MGQFEYELKSLADEQLLSGLANIVRQRNQITAESLAYLAELDERRLFLELGFSSLFEYCVEQLGLCESTAGRHIAAARVCRSYPAVFGMVARGTLHASALSLLRKHLTPENAGELFELCSQRSARKVEALLAARFPQPDVRDLVRRLPVRAEVTLNVECSSELPPADPPSESAAEPRSDSVESLEVLAEPPTASASREPSSAKPRRIEPLSADRYGVHFTADSDFCQLLERVRGLAAHRLPSGDLMTLLKRGLEAYERELEKGRFRVGQSRRSRKAAPSDQVSTPKTPNPKRNLTLKPKRGYPAAVTRAVYQRDGKQCTFVSSEGRRCGARWCLELDHIQPVAAGGECTVENLRLRCRAHNQWYARQYFGKSRVDAAILRERERKRAAPGG